MENIYLKRLLSKSGLLTLAVFVLIVLSYSKALDGYVDNHINESLKSAAITYATARGINALISVVQTAEIEADMFFVSGSVDIGELLDPVNDLVERFSSIMTLALGSLAGQKVLTLISAYSAFNWLLLVLGALTVLFLFMNRHTAFNIAFKGFLIVVFIRFALVLSVLANSFVENLILIEQTLKNDEQISSFKEDITSLSRIQTQAPDKDLKEKQIAALEQKNAELTSSIEDKTIELDEINDRLKDCSFMSYLKSTDCYHFESEKYRANQKIGKYESEIEQNNEIIEKIKLGPQNASETDGKSMVQIWKGSIPNISAQEIEEKMEESIGSFMNLMAIYLLRTLIIPLLFLFFFYRGIKVLWSVNTSKLFHKNLETLPASTARSRE